MLQEIVDNSLQTNVITQKSMQHRVKCKASLPKYEIISSERGPECYGGPEKTSHANRLERLANMAYGIVM